MVCVSLTRAKYILLCVEQVHFLINIKERWQMSLPRAPFVSTRDCVTQLLVGRAANCLSPLVSNVCVCVEWERCLLVNASNYLMIGYRERAFKRSQSSHINYGLFVCKLASLLCHCANGGSLGAKSLNCTIPMQTMDCGGINWIRVS